MALLRRYHGSPASVQVEGYFVTHRAKCGHCQGSGYLYNPHWAEFNRQHRDGVGDPLVFFGVRQDSDLPWEEMPCCDCEGSGYQTRELSLATALEALGVSIAATRQGENAQ